MNHKGSTIASIASIVVLLAIALPARAGDVLDRIVATVDNHIILQSEWQDAVRYEAFVDDRSMNSSSNLFKSMSSMPSLLDMTGSHP